MKDAVRLSVENIHRRCEAKRIPLGDSGVPLRPVGQERAESALRFALRMTEPGFNVYAAGPSATGKRWLCTSIASEFAAQQQTPDDLLYVPDPGQCNKLLGLSVRPGRAYILARNMDRFLAQLSQAAGRDDCLQLLESGMAEFRNAWPDEQELRVYLERLSASLRDQAQLVSDSVWLAQDGAQLLQAIHPLWSSYRFHVMSDHAESRGAPVAVVLDPDMESLFGYAETTTDGRSMNVFPGLVHQVNGGVLILDVQRLFQQSEVWERLKAVMLSGQTAMYSTVAGQQRAIACEPVAVNIKFMLFGDRAYYNRFYERDPEFADLFKVIADFAESMPWDQKGEQAYAQVIAHLARQLGLPAVAADAVARLIEHGSRQAEDQKKLSLCFGDIADVMLEAAYWAGDSERITAEHVEQAITQREYRSNQPCEEMLDETERGELLIDTQGSRIGQVNGLSVVEQGEAICGHPSRITARVHIGKGEVVDIEREVDLGGPIHSKGVLILHGYIAGRYLPNKSLSLSASLVFEQTYGGVEGDSASSAELFALLSALSGLPVNQGLGVTGSVNQMGDMQSIGAVNEKIEGYFNLCQSRGLSGEHGVIIPQSNVQHLMLKPEVVAAVEAGRFHIYAVDNVDQGMTLLTGVEAGERDSKGNFPAHTINGRVEARLLAMSESGEDKEEDKAEDQQQDAASSGEEGDDSEQQRA